jgi:probable phosphomutase (TIGR03848 family)
VRRRASPTLIVLVRHGATPTTGRELPGRAAGLHLSDSGRQQAEAAAGRVAALETGKRRVAAVYASPLERTQETAAPIAKAVDLEVQVDEALVELDVGEWTGLELKNARKRREWATIQRYPSGFRFPGGESFQDMQSRMVARLDRLRLEHPGEMVVAVSHADPIRAVLAHALGTHLDLFQRIVVSPCSLSLVAYDEAGPLVLAVNATHDAQALTPA